MGGQRSPAPSRPIGGSTDSQTTESDLPSPPQSPVRVWHGPPKPCYLLPVTPGQRPQDTKFGLRWTCLRSSAVVHRTSILTCDEHVCAQVQLFTGHHVWFAMNMFALKCSYPQDSKFGLRWICLRSSAVIHKTPSLVCDEYVCAQVQLSTGLQS